MTKHYSHKGKHQNGSVESVVWIQSVRDLSFTPQAD